MGFSTVWRVGVALVARGSQMRENREKLVHENDGDEKEK
jgi:hypothetical protein